MKNIVTKIVSDNRTIENKTAKAIEDEIDSPLTKDDRRSFLKKSLLGGISIAGLSSLSFEDTVSVVTSNVQRSSSPSELKITDMRYTTISNGTGATNARNVIIRIDTNQGIYGLGEVRDGADARYALFLKSRLLGRNPVNVEMIFKTLKQYGGHGRMGGGVSGVEMALWDLAGKVFNTPVGLITFL